MDRLTEELKGVDPSSTSWTALEKIPYLSAVVAEGLRLSYGISSRVPRIPHENLIYRGQIKGQGQVEYVIPKGSAIGSKSSTSSHKAVKELAD
jgi:hypothetical protein